MRAIITRVYLQKKKTNQRKHTQKNCFFRLANTQPAHEPIYYGILSINTLSLKWMEYTQ